VKCPRCKGHGRVASIREGGGFGGKIVEWHTSPCSLCNGTGRISFEQFTWCVLAQRLEELRTSIGMSMAEAAREYGVDLLVWNDAEHGRADPRPMIAFVRHQGATA